MEHRARQGSVFALAELSPPEFPDALTYLYMWLHELHGRSGVSMNGVAPLTYGTIADWARLTGSDPSPEDTRALLSLDAILCNPPKADAGTVAPASESTRAPIEPWPTKKVAPEGPPDA